MRINDLKISARLALGLGTMLLASFLMLLASIVTHDRTQRASAEVARHAHAQQELALGMRHALMAASIAVRNMGLNDSVEGVQAAEKQARSERENYLGKLKALQDSGLDGQEQALLQRLRGIDEAMARDFKEAVDLASQFNAEQAARLITKKIDPASVQALETLNAFIEMQHTQAAAAQARVDEGTVLVERGLALAGLVTLLVSGFIGWRLSRSIVEPLRAAMSMARQVAAGDLTVTAASDARDETGELLRSLHGMAQQLQTLLNEVRQATHGIATASGEIAAGNQQLSGRTEETASSLQNAASALQQMTQRLAELAESASQAQGMSAGAADVARQGGETVRRVVETMSEIQKGSQRIAEITGVIDGIAFQTNILALNAAVEAARAGEQGRGFAVVASEVRSLAQRSAQAAREIKSLIGASTEKVASGTHVAADAGKTMAEVVDAVNRVNEIIRRITTAAAEQSSGVSAVNQAVSQLDEMTQQNAALVEQSAAASESMKDQARRLSGLVDTFRVA